MAITVVAKKIKTFRDISSAIFRDFKFLFGYEKSRARARDAWKMHFCNPRPVSTHAHFNLRFDNTDDNRIQKVSDYFRF